MYEAKVYRTSSIKNWLIPLLFLYKKKKIRKVHENESKIKTSNIIKQRKYYKNFEKQFDCHWKNAIDNLKSWIFLNII